MRYMPTERSKVLAVLVVAVTIGVAVLSGPATTALAAPGSGALVVRGTTVAGTASRSIWSVEPTVNPKSNQVNDTVFQGVSASGPDEAWAVGIYADQKALDHPLAEHWNGTSWSQATVPQPAGEQAVFHGVDDLGPDDAWAVGTSFSGGAGATAAGLTLIENWNGTAWSIVPSPNPAKVFEHWNGTTWSSTSASPVTPGCGLNDDSVSGTLAANWNGTAWSIKSTPGIEAGREAQNELTGVSGTGPDDVWASGFVDNVNDQNLRDPYGLHWGGKRWALTKVPNPNSNEEGSLLNSVQALTPTDAWAVGQTQENNGSSASPSSTTVLRGP